MTRIDSTQLKWRVQVRRSRAHKWHDKGLFETRERAREEARWWRYGYVDPSFMGLGNQRVVRHISGKGR